ncbi:MAG: hypothetical protein JW761_09290 [Prolixibacteraceae bacterium]|nr:hypothetical protein [Prolixibacteraceae bacterium]
MEKIEIIKDIQKNDLKKINGGGKIAENIGRFLHSLYDSMYKAALIESTYSHNGAY